ncbi:hypothetical protein TrRE_jg987, partial [Triparma retinervis]
MKCSALGETRTFEWRERQLKQVLKFLEEQYSEIAAALTADLGKCSFEGEITEIEVVRTECKEALEKFRCLLSLRWDLIFFTGSETVGKIVASAASKTLSPVVLELGGKAPLIVSKDAPDLKAMADRIMWGKTINAGQTCVAPDYVMVHEDRLEEVLEAFKRSLKDMFGETTAEIKKSSFARNVSEASTKRLISMIEDAEASGGEIIAGGTKDADVKDKFFPPTLILNPGRESRVLTEEIFGCVLPIIPYSSTTSCVSYINSINGVSTPLALYVFTTSDAEFSSYLDLVPSGGAVQNDVLVHFACGTLPFGGLGTSGYGRAHGKFGFEAFTHTRGVLSKPCRKAFEFQGIRYPPYDKYGGWSGWTFKLLSKTLPEIPVLHSGALKRAVMGGMMVAA